MPIQDSNDRYGTVSRVLHWGMALLRVWQFLSAGAHALLSDTAVEEFFWGTHRPRGFLRFVLIIRRALWARINRSRRPPSVSLAARLGHLAFYALLLGIPAFALLRQYGGGKPFEPFGIPLMGGLGGEEIEWMQVPANLFHGWAGWLLLLMIVGHIVMVARHRKAADQTDVLPRMWG